MSIQIRLPDEQLTFNRAEFSEMKEAFTIKPGGIYVLRDVAGDCLYVGKSIDVVKRLGSHFSSSEFAPDIDNVTVYRSSSESDRDIYETYAIKVFKPRYNRAKVDRAKVRRADVELIEDLTQELYDLKIQRGDIENELQSIDITYGKPKKPRLINNFTGEISSKYEDYESHLDYFEEFVRGDYDDDKRELRTKLRLADEEIREISGKILKLREKVRV